MILEKEYLTKHLLRIKTDEGFYMITTGLEERNEDQLLCVNKYENELSTRIIGTWMFEGKDIEWVQDFFEKSHDADIGDLLAFLMI
jgi:hypothetical protein